MNSELVVTQEKMLLNFLAEQVRFLRKKISKRILSEHFQTPRIKFEVQRLM